MTSRCKGKKCPSTKICNPSSGRCILKKGKLGKQLKSLRSSRSRSHLKSRSRSHLKYSSSSRSRSGLKESVSNLFKVPKTGIISKQLISKIFGYKMLDVLKEYDFLSYLGGGAFGETYKGCKSNGECEAIKFTEIDEYEIREEDVIREYKLGQIFHTHGIGPKIYSLSIVNNGRKKYGIIKMEKIDGTLPELLYKTKSYKTIDLITDNLVYLIDSLCKYNLIHGDLHIENIAFTLQDKFTEKIYPKLLLIDFGWSCCLKKQTKCNPKFEMQQLLRTGYNDGPKMNKKMFVRYIQNLYDVYVDTFGGHHVNLKTFDDAMDLCDKFDKIQKKSHDKYRKEFHKPDSK